MRVSAEQPLPRTPGGPDARGRAAGRAEGSELADTEAQCPSGPGRARGKGTASSHSTFLTRRTRPAFQVGCRTDTGRVPGGRCVRPAPCTLSLSHGCVSESVHTRLTSCARASLEVSTVVPTLRVAHSVPLAIWGCESEPTRHLRLERPRYPSVRVWSTRNLTVLRVLVTGSLYLGKQQEIWVLVPILPLTNS